MSSPTDAAQIRRDPARVLIVRLSHLGDVVSALPVYRAVRTRFPAARVGWVVQPEFADLLRGLKGLERVFLFERRGGWRAWPKLRRELRGFAPELTIDAQSNLKSAAATLCSGAPRRLGLHRRDWRERAGAFVLNENAPALNPETVNATERMWHLARHVAGGGLLQERIDLELSAAEIRRGDELADQHLPRTDAPLILCTTAPGDVRSWPEQHWVELTRLGADRGVLLLSGPAERASGERIRAALGPQDTARHWIGQRGLRDLAAFFHSAATRGAQVIACDSGPMHLAAACGLPVVTLDGPQDAERTGPWPRSAHRSVRAADTPQCAPCLARSCSHPEGTVCMSELRPGQVLTAAERPTGSNAPPG